MRRLLAVMMASAVLAACSGPTGPDHESPTGPLQMALVSGDGQQVAVTDTLPSDIVVSVTKGGVPLTDQLVDWVVLTDNCGSPFVTTTRTDADGTTGNRIVAGTRAWTRPEGPSICQMEVRYALTDGDSVIARVDTTVGYLVEPGAPSDTVETGSAIVGVRAPGTFPAGWLADGYGNPVPWRFTVDSIFAVQGTNPDSADARTLAIRDAAANGDSAVVCAWGEDGGLIFPALGVVHDGGTDIRLEIHGDPDTSNAYGTVQAADCTS